MVVSEKVEKRRTRAIIVIVAIVVISVGSLTVWWFMFRTNPAGTFSKFNISFDYPEGTKIEEIGILERYPDVNSGMVVCAWSEGAIEYSISIGWIKTLQFDIDASFKGSFDGMTEEGATNIICSEREETKLNGYTLYYETFELDMNNNKHYYGVSAIANFQELEKVFIFFYVNEYDNPFQGLMDILETFEVE